MEYGRHLAYSASRGLGGGAMFTDAWSHDDITFNVANLGSIMDAAGFLGGVTGDGYSAVEREKYNKVGSAFGAAGLDLRIGAQGIRGSVGSSGYNLMNMGMRIGKGFVLNTKLTDYAATHGTSVGEVLKTTYGYGDFAGEETVWRLALGKDRLELGSGDGKAHTRQNESGDRIMRILAGGGGEEVMLDLAVSLRHETWRDGSKAGDQRYETFRAAQAHTAMEMSLAQSEEYGASMMGLINGDANYQNDIAHYLGKDFASYVANTYDSSSDYWKLTADGTLINDGKARLLVEIVKDDGTQGWRLVEGSDKETSVAAALTHYLGESRAKELLGGSLTDVSRYDDQTLRDVLNLDDVDIKTIRNNPAEAERIIQAATGEQRQRLLGEALMKSGGITWDPGAKSGRGAWLGEGIGLTLTDGVIHGDAAIRSIGRGEYERYSITAEVQRSAGAYDVWKNGEKGDLGAGNTRIMFTKWDIDLDEQVAWLVAGGAWNSVDNSYGQLDAHGNPIGANQPYQVVAGPLLQGNTIAEGSLNMRWAQNGSYSDWGDVFILSDTRTIAGERILSDGDGEWHQGEGRWLMHYTNYGSSDGCIVSGTKDPFISMMSSLKAWGLYQGYSIASMLRDDNEFPYRPGYRRGGW